jgi:hypothetical protein
MMNATRNGGVALLLFLVCVLPAVGAGPLFPKPIHLVREIDDSLSPRPTRIDQYCFGDRVVTVRGARTAIADYGKQELTEIDRAAATYSVAPFAQIAAARPSSVKAPKSAVAPLPTIVRKGQEQRAGRSVDLFTADDAGSALHAEVAIDPSVSLTKDAFDVISGGAFPNTGGPAVDLVRGAAARRSSVSNDTASPSAQVYGLPVEQTLRWQTPGQAVVLTNRVISMDEQQAPAELIAIPPGARRIESRVLEARRVAADSDAPVPSRSEH